MVILSSESVLDVHGGNPVCQDIMRSLYIERFLDFCVRRDVEMEEDQGGEETREEEV